MKIYNIVYTHDTKYSRYYTAGCVSKIEKFGIDKNNL